MQKILFLIKIKYFIFKCQNNDDISSYTESPISDNQDNLHSQTQLKCISREWTRVIYLEESCFECVLYNIAENGLICTCNHLNEL